MKIQNIAQQVTSLQMDSTIQQAVAAMVEADCGFYPVVDQWQHYLGVVTLQGMAAAGALVSSDKTIAPWVDTQLAAIDALTDFGDLPTTVDHFVVTDKDNEVVGIVTTPRFVKCLLDYFFDSERMVNSSSSEAAPGLIKGLLTEAEAIISSSYDGMFITDGQGVVLSLNKAYERITGVEAQAVIGKTMAHLVKEGVYNQSVTLLVLERKERVTINQTVKPYNKNILVTGNPVFGEKGQIVRVVSNVRDVTELNNLQRKLSQIEAETLKYQTELSHLRSLQLKSSDTIFRSKGMATVVELAVKVADVSSTVLITGESGTGKELIAKLIHREGKGSDKPFIKLNCGAIPETLLESELFGYDRGAFTGARKEGKPGLVELANGGTLFLDEIGEMPSVLQVKLLRIIQEKTVIRVGGIAAIPVDVRFITATHRDLAKMVQDGTFREDLYYRLMVVPIALPPLRERKEDIPLLVMHFIDQFNRRFGYQLTIMPQVMDILTEYHWPGNVRELENVIERMMVTTRERELTLEALPKTLLQQISGSQVGVKLKDAVAQTEKVLLFETFRQHGSWHKVAQELGIDRTTAFRKAVKYGLITPFEGEEKNR